MDPTAARTQWLTGLASHLRAKQAGILKAWRAYVDADPELTTPASLPRALFNDHIPAVLETFAERLRTGLRRESVAAAGERVEEAEAHGLQRWQQGYRLREVTREWTHLQRCLLDELHNYAAAHRDVDPAVLHAAYRGLVELCSEGISDSTGQYFHLEQIEALGQVRDLSQTLDQLRELERERADLWREAAHDLRGNFGVVANAAAGLTLQAVPEPMREKFFRLLQSSVSSVHSMLDDVMTLARLQAGQEHRRPHPFDAALLLREMSENFQRLASERGLFLKAEGPERLDVAGDPVKVRRIVQNLILNALKYTQSGGVTVSWGASRAGDAERWMLTIRDTGPGIHAGPGAPIAEALEVATQEASRVNRRDSDPDAPIAPSDYASGAKPDARPVHQEQGEGIGLSIVKRLCDLLDASVEVESKAGEGTVFRIVFPRSYPEAEASLPR
jgi:signal transduction histidine kinase